MKCSKLYKKESNKYTVGSLVFIKTDTISGITSTGFCSYDSSNNYDCPERVFYNSIPTKYSYYCGVDLENNSYTSNFGDKLLNKCTEEEFANMFGDSNNWHGDYGSIRNDFPGSFIMPAHDVYIDRYIEIIF